MRARSRRSIRASEKPAARAATSTVLPCPIRFWARSTRNSCWYLSGVRPVAVVEHPGQGPLANPRRRREVGQPERIGEPGVNEVLDVAPMIMQVDSPGTRMTSPTTSPLRPVLIWVTDPTTNGFPRLPVRDDLLAVVCGWRQVFEGAR